MRNKRGFSLLEVLIGVFIISIAFSGIISVFIGSRKYVLRSQKRLGSANVARDFIESLRNSVRASTWENTDVASNPLAKGIYNTSNKVILEGVQYDVNYAVSDAETGSGNKAVKITISYPELQ